MTRTGFIVYITFMILAFPFGYFIAAPELDGCPIFTTPYESVNTNICNQRNLLERVTGHEFG